MSGGTLGLVSTASHRPAPPPAEIWSAGDYAEVCDRMIPGLGARLVELAGVRTGTSVLDVAAGSGNASLPAALTGASVTAIDITPALLDVAKRRANEAGLAIRWLVADAQSLPFDDGTFDYVLSCVGVQFCAEHDAAAAELCRVCRPGGRIALASWTPEGFIGRVLAAISAASGGNPGRPSPLDWGREERVGELLRRPASQIAFRREHAEMPAESPEAWVDFMAGAYGPMVKARAAMETRNMARRAGDAWSRVREELIEIAAACGVTDGAGFTVQAEYLAAVCEG